LTKFEKYKILHNKKCGKTAFFVKLFVVDRYRDALGMMIHMMKYGTNPGKPPGSKRIRNSNRNQNALIPKNSPKPPHTPAITRFLLERLN